MAVGHDRQVVGGAVHPLGRAQLRERLGVVARRRTPPHRSPRAPRRAATRGPGPPGCAGRPSRGRRRSACRRPPGAARHAAPASRAGPSAAPRHERSSSWPVISSGIGGPSYFAWSSVRGHLLVVGAATSRSCGDRASRLAGACASLAAERRAGHRAGRAAAGDRPRLPLSGVRRRPSATSRHSCDGAAAAGPDRIRPHAIDEQTMGAITQGWPPSEKCMFGGVLLSHILSGAVPSALAGLTSGFGMGPGVSRPLWPP